MLTPAWTPLIDVPQRTRAALTTARNLRLACGRGSGKTEICKRRLVAALRMRRPWKDPRYGYGAPTEQQARYIAWHDLVAMTPKAWLAKDPEVGPMRITTRWGSTLQVFGLDKPQRAEGQQYDGWVVDERCDIRPGVVDLSIVPMLTLRNGWLIESGVPKRVGIGAKEYRERWERAFRGDEQGVEAYTWTSEDVLLRLNPAAIAEAKARMSPKDYAEQMLARWETAGGLIYFGFARGSNFANIAYDPRKPLLLAGDFNVDPMAWLALQRRGDGLHVLDEFWIRDAHTQMMLDEVWSRFGAQHQSTWEFYVDASGGSRKTSASETDIRTIFNDQRFRKAGRTIGFPRLVRSDGRDHFEANPPVEERYAAVNALLRSAAGKVRLTIDPRRCSNLVADLESCHYREGTRQTQKGHDLTHATDALGYCVWALFPVPYVTTPSAGEAVFVRMPGVR